MLYTERKEKNNQNYYIIVILICVVRCQSLPKLLKSFHPDFMEDNWAMYMSL